MQNFYAIEIEAAVQRREREREAAADGRAARARPQKGRIRRLQLPHLVLSRLRALPALTVRLPDLCHIAEGRDMPTA
jgi:hypothetical protein